MGKKFKLAYYLNDIVKDIVNEKYVPSLDITLKDKIFEYLDGVYDNEGVKAYNSISLIKEKFQKELVTEAVCEMTDEEDYLAPTINKKISEISKEYLKEWINDKITL